MSDPAPTPRGIRNNNPGNIRRSQTLWQGEAAVQTDPDFIVFQGPEWGLRAIAKILLTYQSHGLKSIQDMISRWAPPSENDTPAYVAAVTADMQRQFSVVGACSEIFLTASPGVLAALLNAITLHENGIQPYSPAQLNSAVALALGQSQA